MPMYEYECSAGHVFERFESLSERGDGKKRCPTCGKTRKCTQQFSTTGTPIFKEGRGGFYKPTRK